MTTEIEAVEHKTEEFVHDEKLKARVVRKLDIALLPIIWYKAPKHTFRSMLHPGYRSNIGNAKLAGKVSLVTKSCRKAMEKD
ncbi:hypothetical protein BC937DRAFT_95166 [Endogone sp. FLAS-F59071]|nr:hypothetical protein BC937DRAFT_95166 [Endogone sp. FLAS-F59071]|eukprot:RUS20465.1 hypothetical protein BC937DRAFT_95166 [Endogone sp. FLAS-F59071]